MEHNNHKRIRADFHDYNGGEYFVTVCTKDRCHFLGEIYNNEMYLSDVGKELEDNIRFVTEYFDDVEIPNFVIMPNHFHAIINISALESNQKVESSEKIINLGRLNQTARLAIMCGMDVDLITHHNNRLGIIVGGIKTHVSLYARKKQIAFGWQKRFIDHIIRGDYDRNNISKYIDNNVSCWKTDCFF